MYYDIFENLCKAQNIRPADVSKETGISKATFSAWKSGDYTPKADKMQKIADYFGVSLDYMMGKDDDKQKDLDKQIEVAKALAIKNADGAGQLRSISRLAKNSQAEKARIFDSILDIMKEEHESGINIDLPQEAMDRWERYKKATPEIQQVIDLLLGYAK